MKRFASMDGRWITLLFLVGYFLILVGGKTIFNRSYTSTLITLGVPAIAPHFIDFHFIVACCESRDAGYDPTLKNPFDGSAKRLFNYPPWWLHAENLGLNEQTYRPIAYAMALVFLALTLFLIGKIQILDGVILGLFLVSPSVVLCLERGNIDQLMFFLIAGALFFRRQFFVAILLLLLAAMLKLFPVFAFPALATPPWRKHLAWIFGGGILFAAYIWFYARELAFTSKNSGRLIYHSFGTMVVRIRFSDWYHFISIHAKWFDLGFTVFFVLLLVAAFRWHPKVELDRYSSHEIMAFRLGAFLFLGIFAIGTSYDYKLIFLVFCLPWLFRLYRGKALINRLAQGCLFFLIVYSNWFLFAGEYRCPELLVRSSLSWGIAATLAVLLAATQAWPSGAELGIASTQRKIAS